MLNKETKRKIIFDLVLVLVLLAVSLSVYFFVLHGRSDGTVVRVSVDGETVGEYSLYINAEYVLNDGTNILCIEDGSVYMKYAECPDKTCVKKGKIHLVNDDITCLPNRVRVEIFEN